MKLCYNGALVMPKDYVIINNTEMVYVEGGLKLRYSILNLSKTVSLATASAIKIMHGWSNISAYDLAAEIYAHTLAYYRFGLVLTVVKKLGYATDIANSILGGIDVENKKDSKKICGVYRYVFYRAVYSIC